VVWAKTVAGNNPAMRIPSHPVLDVASFIR
jgi:hypothetical protein